jgi:hypothetical protein
MTRLFRVTLNVSIVALSLLFVLLLTVYGGYSTPVSAAPAVGHNIAAKYAVQASALPQTTPVDEPLFCRFGTNFAPSEPITNYDINALRTGWYIDYLAEPAPLRPGGVEYAPMIHLSQRQIAGTDVYTYSYSPAGNRLRRVIEGNPGADIFVGNEPDRILYQDSMDPDLYAEAYHEIYHFIKSIDPTTRVQAGSIVQPTEVRLEYLDAVLAHYRQEYGEPMPVDVWSIHNFILNEASCDHFGSLSLCWGADMPPGSDKIEGFRIKFPEELHVTRDPEVFKTQLLRFRNWMNANGYQGVPVYLSEYGVLLPDDYGYAGIDLSAPRVNEFMDATFDYMLNAKDPVLGDPTDDYRLIQRFSWFSINDDRQNGGTYNGNLFNAKTKQLSSMGQNFADYTTMLTEEADLYPLQIQVDPPAPQSTNGPVTATVSARIANAGNTITPITGTVRFYNGDPKQGGTQIGAAQTVSLSGCGDDTHVEVIWEEVPPGNYQIYVEVLSPSGITDVNSQNNLQQRAYFFSNAQTFLPFGAR